MVEGYLVGTRNKFGLIGDLGTTEQVISLGGQVNIPYLTSAVVVSISSTSVNDTLLGSGARTVRVSGVDEVFNEIEEIVTLAGQSAALTVLPFWRVYRLQVLTAGATGFNEGLIHCGTGALGSGIPAVKLIEIGIGDNQTLAAFWTSPAGATADLRSIMFSGGRTVGNVEALITLRLMVRELGGLWTLKWKHHLIANSIRFPFPRGDIEFGPGTDWEVRATSSAAATAVGADLHFELFSL
jgi:hypothetical protein